jgi:hypothetical protein
MGDIQVYRQRNDLSKPNVKVQKLWLEQQIAEKKARVQRLQTDAFEIMEGRLKSIQADIIMAERDVLALTQKLDDLELRYEGRDEEIIDISKENENG